MIFRKKNKEIKRVDRIVIGDSDSSMVGKDLPKNEAPSFSADKNSQILANNKDENNLSGKVKSSRNRNENITKNNLEIENVKNTDNNIILDSNLDSTDINRNDYFSETTEQISETSIDENRELIEKTIIEPGNNSLHVKKESPANAILKNHTKKSAVANKSSKTELLKERFLKGIQRNTRLIIALIPIMLIIILLVALVSQALVIYATKAQIEKFTRDTNETKLDMTTRINSVNDKYTDERLRKILLEKDLYVYSNSFWKYEILINGNAIKSDLTSLPSTTKTVTIELRESRKASFLPDSIILIGSVTRADEGDTLSNHIKIVSEKIDGKINKKDLTSSLIFTKNNISPNSKLVIEISDQLASKLNIPYSQLTVKISK